MDDWILGGIERGLVSRDQARDTIEEKMSFL